jgi:O-antigen ligase
MSGVNSEGNERAQIGTIDNLGSALIILLPIAALANVLVVGRLWGLSIRPTDLVFVSAVAVWVFRVGLEVVGPGEVNRYLVMVGSLIVLSLVGEAFLGNAMDWPRYLRFIQTILWGVLAFAFVRSEKQFNLFLNMVILLGMIMAGVSIELYVVNPELHRIAGYVSFAGGEGLDAQASYNEWGALFAVALVILFCRLHKRPMSLGWTASLVTVLCGLLLTQSRSAFLATVAALCVLIFLYFKGLYVPGTGRGTLAWILLLLAVVGGAVAITSAFAINRVADSLVYGSNAEESIETRLDLWEKSLDLGSSSVHRFLIGYGDRSFESRIDSPTADSFYLDHLVSEGFIGLMLVLMLLIRPAVRVWRADRSARAGILGVLVLLVALVVSLTGNVLVDPTYGGITFALLYGLLSVYGRGDYMRAGI